MAKKVIDIEIKPTGIKTLNAQLEDLKRNISKANDPAVVEKLNKTLNTTEKEIESINKELDNFSMGKKFDDVYKDLAPLSSRLGELEDRMYELAFAGKANTDEFRALQKEAISMRQTIIEVDKQVDILADNRGLSAFGDGIGAVGMSLGRLDFETASKQASTLATAASEISFGSAIKSLKQLGSTFVSLGKALLMNPLFLIASVVIALGVAIYKLMDELGFLKVIFEAIGDAIGWVIQQFKDLFDWLGLTSYAAEDAADRKAAAAKKAADAQEAAANQTIAALDHEIRRIQATGDESDEAFEKILAAEKEKRVQLFLTAKARAHEAMAAYDAAILKGDLDDEEIKDLQLKTKAVIDLAKAAGEELITADLEADKRRRDRADAQLKEAEGDAQKLAAIRQAQRDKEKQLEEERQREISAIAEAQLRADEMIRKANIEFIDDEILRAEQMAIFNEEMAFKSVDLTKLTQDQKEILEQQHQQRLLDIEQLAIDKRAEMQKKAREDELKEQKRKEDVYLDVLKASIAKQKALEDEKAEYKSAVEQGSLQVAESVIGAISANVEEGSKAAKGAAVAQATVDTYKGATAAFSSLASIPVVGPALGGIAAGAAVAMGIANVRKILATDTKGGGGAPSPTSFSAPVASATPNISLFGQSNDLNSLSQPTSVESDKPQVIKAFVVESDISESQKKMEKINQSAEL